MWASGHYGIGPCGTDQPASLTSKWRFRLRVKTICQLQLGLCNSCAKCVVCRSDHPSQRLLSPVPTMMAQACG